jgi:hypothetical protein
MILGLGSCKLTNSKGKSPLRNNQSKLVFYSNPTYTHFLISPFRLKEDIGVMYAQAT